MSKRDIFVINPFFFSLSLSLSLSQFLESDHNMQMSTAYANEAAARPIVPCELLDARMLNSVAIARTK